MLPRTDDAFPRDTCPATCPARRRRRQRGRSFHRAGPTKRLRGHELRGCPERTPRRRAGSPAVRRGSLRRQPAGDQRSHARDAPPVDDPFARSQRRADDRRWRRPRRGGRPSDHMRGQRCAQAPRQAIHTRRATRRGASARFFVNRERRRGLHVAENRYHATTRHVRSLDAGRLRRAASSLCRTQDASVGLRP